MAAGRIRILDTLLSRANSSGVVSMSQGWIAIDSAVAKAAGAVRTLIKDGWLVLLVPGTWEHRAIYRLAVPDGRGDEKNHTLYGPTPLSPLSQSVFNVVFYVAHDAFRCRAGSLHSAYPLLTLLTSEPQSLDTLASRLRVTPRALRDRVGSIVQAGLAVQRDGGLALTNDPVRPLLDAVAIKVGTYGDRASAKETYRLEMAEWKRTRAEAGEIGSETWRKIRRRDLLKNVDTGGVAALVDHLGGDVDAAVDYLVDLEVETYNRVDEDFVAFLAATDDRASESPQ
jgi:hypothetical protein